MENDVLGWMYYNHAAVTTTAPHEQPNLIPLKDGSIWNLKSINGQRPLLARYITDFDCGKETEYWYVVKDAPFVLSDLSKKYQKNIARALDRCEVRQIDPITEFDNLYEVYKAALEKYNNADNAMSKESFFNGMKNDNLEYWAAYDVNSGKMAGWMSCRNNGDWTETVSSKYHPMLQVLRPSDAIHYTILNHYLNDLNQKYVCSGTRNLNHKTNVQDYKIDNLKFRKAYCKLHIVYRKEINVVIKLLYPFRKLLKKFDSITLVHQINSILLMEKISRSSN